MKTTQTFKNLTKKFSYVNSNIESNFPLEDRGLTDYKLFHFDRYISSEEAIEEMKKEGYVPANLLELLTWPAWNEEDVVMALGSVAEVDGDRRVPCLDGSGWERELNLDDYGGGWGAVCRFLAVRNSTLETSEPKKLDPWILGRLDAIEEIIKQIKKYEK